MSGYVRYRQRRAGGENLERLWTLVPIVAVMGVFGCVMWQVVDVFRQLIAALPF